MALLDSFSPPANLSELSPAGLAAWSAEVARMIEGESSASLPHFFNPLDEGPEADVTTHPVRWPAFPATLQDTGVSDAERWQRADSSRDNQDEYCEWGIERDGGKIVAVTFTTETPDYYELLFKVDQDLLRDLYEQLTGSRPEISDLTGEDGEYDPLNELNRPGDGGIVHLSQGSNTLGAAIDLVAKATVLRERDGEPVTDRAALVKCGGLGEPRRNSDPQIAGAVNGLVRGGREVSLSDPPGLYLHEFIGSGIQAPDGADAGEFWQVTRGDREHALRARFEVPAERGYAVGDLELDGKKVETGAQLADRVRVRVVALSRPSTQQAAAQPCKGE
jgi:hypothetical protein